MKGQFTETFLSTIGFDKQVKILKVNGMLFRIVLWDTAGQERFRSLPKKYYQNADGIFLFFDVTNEVSFENVAKWMDEVNNFANKSNLESFCDFDDNVNEEKKELNIYLIGHKIDLVNKRKITKEKAVAKAQGY